jgi:hypothetical protein
VAHWVVWRGNFPSTDEVNALIASGQQIRPQLELLRVAEDGTRKPYTLLAEFCNFEERVIIRVDERSATAVTLIVAGRTKIFERLGEALDGDVVN